VFAGENRVVVSCFKLVIDKLVSRPFSFARIIPKGNVRLKDLAGSRDRVGKNYNVMGVIVFHGRD